MVSTGLTRARRFQAALALDPSRLQRSSLSHSKLENLTSTTLQRTLAHPVLLAQIYLV
jgi:hypothetical protein